MAPKKGPQKGKVVELKPVYSDVITCWKREKQLKLEAQAGSSDNIDEDLKDFFLKQIQELTERENRWVGVWAR